MTIRFQPTIQKPRITWLLTDWIGRSQILRRGRIMLIDSVKTSSSVSTDDDRTTLTTELNAVFLRICDRLQSELIPYCLLRNRDRIPHGLLQGSDVDLVVPTHISPKAILEITRDLDIIHVIKRFDCTTVYYRVIDLLIKVDFINHDRCYISPTYLRNEDILDARMIDQGIPVASLVHQSIDAWIGNLLFNATVKPRYEQLILSAASHHREEFQSLLKQSFGEILARKLWECIESGDLNSSINLVRSCRRTIWVHAIRRTPLVTATRTIRYIIQQIGFRIRTPGLTVAVLGPDGSGKSTLCHSLSSMHLPDIPFSAVEVEHLYRPVLPSPANLRKGRLRQRKVAAGVVTDPHGKAPNGALLSALRVGYFLCDHWLSEILRGRHSLARNRLRLFDRHMIELSVDPRRFRYGGPLWLARLLAKMAPQADLVIYLDAPSDVLRSRKQELSDKELERQRVAYRSLVERLQNGYVVDASQPLPEVVDEVRNIIIQFLAQRTSRRFNLETML